MFSVKTQEGARKRSSSGQSSAAPSQALQWIWNYLQDAANLRILDCGAVSAATINVLTQRHARVYVADMIAPLQRGDPAYWQQAGKQTVFRLDELLKQLPVVPPTSLSLIFGWHLLDLVPRENVAQLVGVLISLLKPGGIFYFFLREPNLAHGKDGRWWLESLTTLGAEGEESGQFPYAPLTNREIERLITNGSLKTFLTRSHRREVVVLKNEEEI